jgi:hypothetical protein
VLEITSKVERRPPDFIIWNDVRLVVIVADVAREWEKRSDGSRLERDCCEKGQPAASPSNNRKAIPLGFIFHLLSAFDLGE